MKTLRYVGKAGCRDKAYGKALESRRGEPTVLDLVSKRPNVVVRAEINGKPLSLKATPLVRDFRDVGAMVYVADTLAWRKDAVDYWSREFDCTFPVRDPEIWRANGNRLSRALKTVAGDEYRFKWLRATSLPAQRRHLASVPKGYDAVCLFSGGIDSLLGAYRLFSEGKRLLLVGHQSEQATAAAQTEVFRDLVGIFPKQARLVQLRVSVSGGERPLFTLPECDEDTHRARSFLFLSLAVTVATMAGVQEIYMPENGLIALNPPLDMSRLGTCSTRTAHPRFLTQFLDVARGLGVFSGTLKNPFLYESKTDMLRGADPKLRHALERSVSCSRPSRYQDRHVRHCGYCVPCLYRRAAYAACGMDRASDYAFDVFAQLDAMTETTRIDFVSLVQFARKYRTLSLVERQAVVLSQGYFPPGVGAELGPRGTSDYSPWVDMLDRWTGEFLDLVDDRASASTKAFLHWDAHAALAAK